MSEEPAPYLTLKPDPGPNDPVIGASGTAYRWQVRPSVPRYEHLQLLQIEFAHNASFAALVASDDRLWAASQKGEQHATIAVELHKRREGMNNLNVGRNDGVEICAVLLIAPGEDPAVYDEAGQQAKVADLKAAGYAQDFFFGVATSSIAGLRAHWSGLHRTLSEAPL